MTGVLVGVDNTTALEIIELERALQDDCKCKSKHVSCPGCTLEVVARKVTCTRDILICQRSFDWNTHVAIPNRMCGSCDRPARDCWKVIPL